MQVYTNIKIKHTPREVQNDMLSFAQAAIKDNKKFIMIDSPVGTGKSLAAMMIMKWYKENYNINTTFEVLTNSKILQEQYTRDFEFMNSLWGKDNYLCDTHSTNCSAGKELCAVSKTACEFCPYSEAWNNFMVGEVALTNFHLFITYILNMEKLWEQKRNKSRMLIIDEAHEFEAVLCDFITTKLSKGIMTRNNFDESDIKIILKALKQVKTLSDFNEVMVNHVIGAATEALKNINRQIQFAMTEDETTKMVSVKSSLENNMSKWEKFITEHKENSDNWIMETNMNLKNEMEYVVTPVWAGEYLDKYIWSKYDHIVFMSGTILDKSLFAFMNGFHPETGAYKQFPSPFPKENRPIYYMKLGKMSYNEKAVTITKQTPIIKRILAKYGSVKGIIHTFSYDNMKSVQESCGSHRLLTHESKNRIDVLNMHIETDRPTVLCSPSMMTGIDLKEDLSRFQVIMKIPYPSLGSEKVKKRMNMHPGWYSWKTVCDLVQSYGRSIRSETDRADTFILDSCFSDVLRRGGVYIPQYMREAIIEING
jgi:ATP-dependent DNA helicase DinG